MIPCCQTPPKRRWTGCARWVGAAGGPSVCVHPAGGLPCCGASPHGQRSTPQMTDYNVPGGKLNRGMAVYDVLAAIKGAEVSAARGTGAAVRASLRMRCGGAAGGCTPGGSSCDLLLSHNHECRAALTLHVASARSPPTPPGPMSCIARPPAHPSPPCNHTSAMLPCLPPPCLPTLPPTLPPLLPSPASPRA